MKQDKKPQPAAYDGLTQQEVADSLGVTRTAVYQIEQRAFKKFKRALAKRIKNIEDLLGD
jgi:DNA-directed RNA polymerase specialized sigma24 family protein